MRETVRTARELIGAQLVVTDPNGERCGGLIVETEAYCADDPASHSYRGRTRRNGSMFLPAGHIYVYRSYGVHWCLNVVTAATGVGEAVLIRAVEPLWGVEAMYRRRGIEPPTPATGNSLDPRLTNGPGKLCQALGITGAWDGVALADPQSPIRVERDPSAAGAGSSGSTDSSIVATPRVGISKNAEVPWRFLVAGNRFVSRVSRPGRQSSSKSSVSRSRSSMER